MPPARGSPFSAWYNSSCLAAAGAVFRQPARRGNAHSVPGPWDLFLQDHYTTHQRGMQSIFGLKSIFQRYLQGNSSIFGHLDQTPIPAAARPLHCKIREKDSFLSCILSFLPVSRHPSLHAVRLRQAPLQAKNIRFWTSSFTFSDVPPWTLRHLSAILL